MAEVQPFDPEKARGLDAIKPWAVPVSRMSDERQRESTSRRATLRTSVRTDQRSEPSLAVTRDKN
jgi:hypothetical protein